MANSKSESILNYTKALGILAAGLWAVFNWNTITWRAADHQQKMEEARQRPQLAPLFDDLSIDLYCVEDLGIDEYRARFVIAGTLILNNPNPLPLRFSIAKSDIRLGISDFVEKTVQKGKATISEIEWVSEQNSMDPYDIFPLIGRNDNKMFVEPGGQIRLRPSLLIEAQLPDSFIKILELGLRVQMTSTSATERDQEDGHYLTRETNIVGSKTWTGTWQDRFPECNSTPQSKKPVLRGGGGPN